MVSCHGAVDPSQLEIVDGEGRVRRVCNLMGELEYMNEVYGVVLKKPAPDFPFEMGQVVIITGGQGEELKLAQDGFIHRSRICFMDPSLFCEGMQICIWNVEKKYGSWTELAGISADGEVALKSRNDHWIIPLGFKFAVANNEVLVEPWVTLTKPLEGFEVGKYYMVVESQKDYEVVLDGKTRMVLRDGFKWGL